MSVSTVHTHHHSTSTETVSKGSHHTVQFYACTDSDWKRLKKKFKTMQGTNSCLLPSLTHLHACCLRPSRKTAPILHTTRFALLLSGRCYRSIKTRTNILQNSFFPSSRHHTKINTCAIQCAIQTTDIVCINVNL